MISLRGLTDHTVKSYSTYIRAYLDYLSNVLGKLPEDVSWEELREYIRWLQKERSHVLYHSSILSMNEQQVIFSVRSRKPGGPRRTVTLENTEFIRRYLMHVLPPGFQKIRYYGFLNNRGKSKNLKRILHSRDISVYATSMRGFPWLSP